MLHMKEDKTINTFAGKLTTLVNKAASLGHTIEDQTLVRKLINVVPDRYLQIVASIEKYSDLSEMTMEEAIGRLKTYEERIKYKKGKQVDNQEKLMFTRYKSKGKYFRGRGRGKHRFSRGKSHENFKKERKMENPLIGHIAPNSPQMTKAKEQSNLVEEDLEPTLLMAILEDSIERNQVKEVEEQKELTTLPKGHKAIGLKWVFKPKKDANGKIIKYKARLVAKGYIQELVIDFEEVSAPVARMETIRLLLVVAVNNKWEVHHLDVKYAFLHGDLKEEVYVTQLEGFIKRQDNGKVYRLTKALYGVRQAPRAWNIKLDNTLKSLDFNKCTLEQAIYIKISRDSTIIVGFYVVI
nr:ribonuclease H-like domain, reverse transcriptase, RNA-dependent DNA polymerase [Tanacetum cinerariifolium]